mgnify:FL=1|tara:strand:- start:1631 stop:2263 length:633 start_codon:yes stop_codon:yes gene_type:complete
MLRTLKLYGDLASYTKQNEFDVVINSAADAVKFLVYNFDGIEKYMSDKNYKVLVNKKEISKDELHDPLGQSSISIVPVISGAGGRIGKILLGGVLIAMSFGALGGGALFGGDVLTFSQAGGISFAGAGFAAKSAFYVGASLALSGISELLFPIPDANTESDPRLSFNFNGVQNTARPGTALPIVYGEIVTGSVVISASVDTNQVQVETDE